MILRLPFMIRYTAARNDLSKQLLAPSKRRLAPLTRAGPHIAHRVARCDIVGAHTVSWRPHVCESILVVVDLPREAPQEAVPAVLGIAPSHDVPHDAPEKGTTVKEERHDEEPRMVVVPAD